MTRFNVLQSITREEEFAEMLMELVKKNKTHDEITKVLKLELTEEELQTVRSAAQNGYPLCFSGMQ